ncbi:MAG: hypothetical protein H0T13_01805 [Actinobacteria bacterium]|nr:hypothetical protein [Actinomycetota bacterium]
MPHSLARFSVEDVQALGAALRALPASAGSIETEAQRLAETLYAELVDDDGAPACALVRVYATRRFESLDQELQDFAAAVLGETPAPTVQCLKLLGTAGDEPDWNDRARSQGHRAIPLPSEQFVERLPMVAQLVRRLGLDIGVVVTPPEGADALRLSQSANDVFHVPEALGSPYLPAQEGFVEPHRIASAVGFGGIMLSGDFFAVLLFSHVPVDEATARTLKILGQVVRQRFLPFTQAVAVRA